MLDVRLLREEFERLRAGLEKRNSTVDLERLRDLDQKRRSASNEADTLRQQRNSASKEIGQLLKAGKDAEAKKEEVRLIGDRIKGLEDELARCREEFDQLWLLVPNLPHDSTPVGEDERSNQIRSEWGVKREFPFQPKPHWEVGGALGMFDFERGTKISGTGFVAYTGWGARLERALVSFMLDLHTSRHGYKEIFPPFLVSRKTLTGTGQLPKFEEDLYRCEVDDLFLIPTAEVPLTNLHSEEILGPTDLPIRYAAYSPCFRREAGSYGKETRGLTRVHQFNKVELVCFVRTENSYEEIERLRGNAEEVLRQLKLPYRVIELCAADIGFGAAKCYDLEVWAPGMGLYLEVSSCSNFEDFQARRAGIRFRREAGAKPEFVHTLNASGVALPRTVIAILENYQQPDGSVEVPEVLRPYLGADRLSL